MSRRFWVLMFVVALVIGGAVLATRQSDEYAFLSDYHPWRVEFKAVGGHTTGNGYVLVFKSHDAKPVIASLKDHLTKQQDYSLLHAPNSGIWIFKRGHTELFEHGAAYAMHGHERELLPNMANLPSVEAGGCVVMVDPEDSWLTQEWTALKNRFKKKPPSHPKPADDTPAISDSTAVSDDSASSQ